MSDFWDEKIDTQVFQQQKEPFQSEEPNTMPPESELLQEPAVSTKSEELPKLSFIPQRRDEVDGFESGKKSEELKLAVSNHRYQKLGGWMLFFVIAIIIVATFVILRPFATTYMHIMHSTIFDSIDEFIFLFILLYIPEVIAAIIAMICVAQIFKRKEKFLKYLQLSQFINILARVIARIALIVEFPGILTNRIIDLVITIGVLTAICALTTLYFCKSVRVRAYMGSDDYIAKAIFRFRNKS